MKKILYTIGLCLLAASCSEDYTDWANPLTHAQKPIETSGLSITAPEALDVATVTGESVQLFAPTLENQYDEVSYTVTLCNEDSTKTADVAIDAEGNVKVQDLQDAIGQIYGYRPVARTVPYTVTAIAKKDGKTYKMTSSGTISITPQAPTIEAAYYYVGASNNWSDTDQTYKLVNGGGDVYDDPVFTVTIPAPKDGDGNRVDNWFKIAPESAYTRAEGFWGGVMVGAVQDGQSDLEGNFVVGQNDEVAKAFCVGKLDDGALYYRLEFNMLEQTYKVTPIGFNEFIYEIGGESGWGANHALAGNGAGQYIGFYYLDSEFKFKPNEDNWDGDYEKVEGTAYEGTLSDQGAGNIDAPEAGFYKIDVDLAAQTYKLTAISSVGIIGNGGDWNTDIELTYNVAGGYWEAYTDLAAGEFKFRANHDWAINWGGTLDDLQQDGANLSVAQAGKYFIRLFLGCPGKQYCTISSFGEFVYEIGNEGGWSTSHALLGNGNGQYSGIYYLDGEFKFKPNADNWDGDYERADCDDYAGTLTPDGNGNVGNAAAGMYKIDVDLAAMTYQLTALTSIGIIGNGGDWDNDIELAYNAEAGCMEVTTELAAGEFKFRANHDWAINWGGSFDNLAQDGSNLSISEAGTYKVQLFLSYAGKHYCTVTKQ